VEGVDTLPQPLTAIIDTYWQRLTESSAYADSSLDDLLSRDQSFRAELISVWAASEFVAQAVLNNPTLLPEIHSSRMTSHADSYREVLREQLRELHSLDYKSGLQQLKQKLRIAHRKEFVQIIWRDICGYTDVHETCRNISRLAEASLQEALSVLNQWSISEWGAPQNEGQAQEMIVIGMGKLGATELNISSDIDLVFAFTEAGQTTGTAAAVEPISNQQFFVRLGQRLIDVIDTITPDGFVFRVDMRLRPYGTEGALAISFDAMESYYQNQGRDWERYALVKAKVVAGDLDRGEEFLNKLKPFIYRRYLDFSMLESLRGMKTQINKQARQDRLANDIKLGPGGIREAEFTVQVLQLIYGGRDTSLQQQAIVKALENLVAGEYLPYQDAREVQTAYEFLRNLENKLQSFSNQQTQNLPADTLHRKRIAMAMGYDHWDELVQELDQQRNVISQHFNEILGVGKESGKTRDVGVDWVALWQLEFDADQARKYLQQQGFEDPDATYKVILDLHKDRKFLTLPAQSRERMDIFMPVLLEATSRSNHPSLCVRRVMPLIAAVLRRTAYLVLLLENPQAMEQLVFYCTASPFISDYLARFPVLLDELLSVLEKPPEKSTLADELKLQLLRVEKSNYEDELECLRYFKQSHSLQVVAAEVSGNMPLMKVSDYLTYIAEVILDAVLSLAWEFLVAKHGFPVHEDGDFGEPGFAIIGYGKLGGLELNYGSDLDLVFIHRADLEKDTVVSEGQQSINSRSFYIKLAQRIITTLGTHTMSGKLYEVDMRLRPSGESGLLVSSLASFSDYQANKAWTWEHQALVRARGIVGDAALLSDFTRVRKEILSQSRNLSDVAQEITSMRERMRKELSPPSSSAADKFTFELKQGAGGIVDIEFMVQFFVLAYAHQYPNLLAYTDNYRILEVARECQLIDETELTALINAYLDFRGVSHKFSILDPGDVKASSEMDEQRRFVRLTWDKVFQPLLDTLPSKSDSPDAND